MIQIIPAIDIIGGQCVRLSQGDYSKKTIYNENPLEVAKIFEANGIKRLHLVDLDGAKQKRIVNLKVLESIAKNTSLEIDFGGGVQSREMIKLAFECGATQVTGGSIAVRNPLLFEEWLNEFGAEAVILGADAFNEKIAVSGWEETTQVSIFNFVKNWVDKGVKYTISTDVNKDGMLQGPSFELYHQMQLENPKLNIIASGGVSNFDDIIQLNNNNIFGVIVGKAIYENKISLSEIERFNANQ